MATHDKPSHLKTSLRSFSDDEIAEILDRSGNWRSLHLGHRDRILGDMLNDNWDPATGDTIAMSSDGACVNGQHRLSAAQVYQRESGKKVWFLVVEGVDPKSAKLIDQNMVRTLTQYMKKEGVKHYVHAAAIASAQARMALKPPPGRKIVGGDSLLRVVCTHVNLDGKTRSCKDAMRVSVSNCLDHYKRSSKDIGYWAEFGARMSGSRKFSRTPMLAALGFQLARKRDTEAKLFFDYLLTGTGMKSGDPILVLRERLIKDRIERSAKMPSRMIAAFVIKTWRAWLTGDRIERLLVKQGEAFPDHIVEDVAVA